MKHLQGQGRLPEITIDGRRIGAKHPPFVIAELSGNHNGDFQRAVRLMRIAKDAGADAVKLQTYTADTITIDCDGPDFRIKGGLWDGRTLYELYREASTPWEWHSELIQLGRKLDLKVFSSPFDYTAVDFLDDLEVPAFKIASFEAIDLPLIEYAASKGKPLIISTGMANLNEITEAVEAAIRGGCSQVSLLHCTSGYPTPAVEANLSTIRDLTRRFECPVGISDHTLGISVPIAAVSVGASIVEKHFTLKRSDGGPDAAFSLEPDELRAVSDGCLAAWQSIGAVRYERAPSERANSQFRRSLYVVRDMAAGEEFTADNVRSIRPGFGLHPKHYHEILGARVSRAVARGTALDWSLIAPAGESGSGRAIGARSGYPS